MRWGGWHLPMNANTKLSKVQAIVVIASLLASFFLGFAPPVGTATAELFFSEYIEGSSNNKALEIYNVTGSAIDLAAGSYSIEIYSNGNTSPSTTIALTDTVADGDVYVVADDGAAPAILAETDQTSTASFFNGNDAVVLKKGSAIIDVIGQVGYDPGSEWGSGNQSTRNNTLRRKASVCQGDTDETDAFDPSLEWDGFAQDTFGGLGTHAADRDGPGDCGDPATFIHDIQGNGASSSEAGNTHVIEGVVVGDFQGTNELKGFFVQEEDGDVDADPLTSEGIFVCDDGFGVNVSVGQVVRIQGDVTESSDLTQLNSISDVAVCDQPGSASAATVALPVSSLDVWEQYEGMLINVPQTLFATDNYNQGRYGEVDLSVGDRLDNPTNVVAPGASALALQDLNDRSRIQLDDGSRVEPPATAPYVGIGDTLRAGDTVSELTGVLSFDHDNYEIHPTGAVNFTRVNTRDATPPAVGGTLKVASFNVLNYFNGDGLGGGFPTSRGADTLDEFNRQRDKIISAISTMDADVIGLMEMENDAAPNSALEDLVDGLNVLAGAGTYDFIDTGVVGSDEIRVTFIYKPGAVTPVGPFKILDSSVDPTFIDTRNRPALAQTFEQNLTAARFTPVVNHLKSKGSACDDVGDPDAGDGQGNCNQTRTDAATALVNWLATDPTGSGDPDFLVIGDLNSYAMEDPITAIRNAGYTNLVESFSGADAYSYVYYGQAGYLDHALASATLTPQVTGVVEWHINADEPAALDYNDHNQPALYNPGPYRASDHDPVVVGLNLEESSGAIIIQKVTDPAGGTGFSFDDNIAAPNSFSLNHGGTKTFNNVVPGPYTVTENDPTPAFGLTDLNCVESGINNSVGDIGARTATINLEPGETVTCTFTNTSKQFTLTVNKAGIGTGTVTSDPVGINCGADCTENYLWNTVVTLTAVPGPDSFLVGWSGDCSVPDTITTVTMDADRACTATFGRTRKVFLPMMTKDASSPL